MGGGREGGGGDRPKEKVRRIWMETTSDIYNCTGQQPDCLTRSASLNAGVPLCLPGAGETRPQLYFISGLVF